MEYSLIDEGNIKRVVFYGNLVASSRVKVLEMTKDMPTTQQKEWILDVQDFDYIDSAGLGMLIEMQEAAQKNGISLTLCGAKPLVRRMFDLSKFDTLFTIVD
jgi:anti-anti-sigma factor